MLWIHLGFSKGDGVIFDTDVIVIRQLKEWTEIMVNWETSNRYEVRSPEGEILGLIAERKGGFLAVLSRLILRSHRSMEIDVYSADQKPMLTLVRPFYWILSDLEVRTAEGARVGSVHGRWSWFRKVYDLRDESDHRFARIESPFWRLWTFPLVGTRAQITKKWRGVLAETFTDSDTYVVDFGGENWSPTQRKTILGAAISVDMDHFENNQGSGGALGLFQ